MVDSRADRSNVLRLLALLLTAGCVGGCATTPLVEPSESVACAGCSDAVCEHPGERRLCQRRWYDPEAGIFNFFTPPATIGAPAPPPPGRFHPVPTRPVFAPRSTVGFAPHDGPAW